MNRCFWMVGCLVMLAVLGCDNKPQQGEADTSQTKTFGPEGMSTSGMGRPADIENINPVIAVKFIGKHKGDDPKPRHVTLSMAEAQMHMPGGKFLAMDTLRIGFYVNTLDVDPAASGLGAEEAVKLRDHLKGPDFFNVKQYPTAEFDAKSIKLNEDGTGEITGTFKMLTQSQELTIPVTHNAEKKLLEAKFELDRTKFGMTYGVENVAEMVEVQISLDGSKG